MGNKIHRHSNFHLLIKGYFVLCLLLFFLLSISVDLIAQTILPIQSVLEVKTFDDSITTLPEIEAKIKSDISPELFKLLSVEKNEQSLVYKYLDNQYTVLIHGGRIIQHSTVTDSVLITQDGPLQFGNTTSREGLSLLRSHPEGEKFYGLLTRSYNFGIEEGFKVNVDLNKGGYRGANFIEENDKLKTVSRSIMVAGNHVEHPVTILAHELQHTANQYVLADIMKGFPLEFIKGNSERLKLFTQMYDEYLAVQRSIEVYKNLIKENPHIASREMIDLSDRSEKALREYVAKKWAHFYGWPQEMITTFIDMPEKRFDITLKSTEEALINLHLRNDLKVPENVEKKIKYEQRGNDFSKMHESIAPPSDSTVKAAFRPNEANIFEIPYIELSKDEIDMVGKNRLSEFYITPQGTTRFFIHPQSLEYYQQKIPNLKPKWGEYAASALASSRSLIVWEIAKSDNYRSLKVSLDATVSGVSRLNKPSDMAHAVFATELLKEIPQSFWAKHNIYVLGEEAAFTPKGVEYGTLDKGYITPKPVGEEVPAFALYSDIDKNGPLIEKLAKSAGLSIDDFYRQKIITPMLDFYMDLYLQYGILPEAHAQNISIVIKDNKVMGFTMLDMGGMNIDLEMRNLKRLTTIPEQHLNHFQKIYAQTDYMDAASREIGSMFNTYFKKGFADGYLKIKAEKDNLDLEALRKNFTSSIDDEIESLYLKKTGAQLPPGADWPSRVKVSLKNKKCLHVILETIF